MEITDFSAPELDVYARLTENQLRFRDEPEKAMFIAESPLVIGRAIDGGYTPISFLVDSREAERQARPILERCPDTPVYTASTDLLKQLTGFPMTRGLLCALRRPALPSVEDLCRGKRRIAVLENVMNPTNVGAIFRSAAALNMDAVLLTPGCADPLYRRASRVSMGTVFQVPWAYIEEPDYPALLHSLGFATAAMALTNDSVSIRDPRLAGEEKLAIILGTEGEGLRPETVAKSRYTVKIPMSHGVDSLNVAAASAVAFWELGNPSISLG